MAGYASIEVELKGVKYTTEGTDSTGLLFFSILFNEDETALIRLGRIEEVMEMFGGRSTSRMKQQLGPVKEEQEVLSQLISTLSDEDEIKAVEAKLEALAAKQQKIEDQLNNEIMLALWQRMERDWEIRLLVAERIVELFRFAEPHAIPEKLVFFEVYKEGDKLKYKFNINLSSSDLLNLFTAIVGPTLADMLADIKKKAKPETEAEPPLAVDQQEQPSQPSVEVPPELQQTPNEVTAVEPKQTRLTPEVIASIRRDEFIEQKAAIQKLLDSNPSDAMRSVLEEQMATVNAQIEANAEVVKV